jgi:hypothetical protein
MSSEEKGAWVTLVVTLGTYLAYAAVIFNRAQGNSVTEVAYVSPLLWSMGIAIALAIILRILVEIARPSDTHKPDPRDRDINRFSEYIGGSVLGVAMLVPFILTMFEAAHFWIANAMYAAFALAALVGTTTKLVAYRRGL